MGTLLNGRRERMGARERRERRMEEGRAEVM